MVERPVAKALVAPGMPQTSPGMDAPHGEAWDVLFLAANGTTKVYQSYPAKYCNIRRRSTSRPYTHNEGTIMKKLSITMMAMTVVFAVGTAYGQAANPPKAMSGAQPACCMDAKAQMGQMDEHMQRMQALHDKVANVTPEERQRLMAEQRQEMQQGMAMMQHGGAMMGGGMGPGTMAGGMTGGAAMPGGTKGAPKGPKAKPMDQRTQMQMMEKRMDMMQMMMQSMLDQQSASGNAMMPAPTK